MRHKLLPSRGRIIEVAVFLTEKLCNLIAFYLKTGLPLVDVCSPSALQLPEIGEYHLTKNSDDAECLVDTS
jgi:hypothetical protein